MLAYLIYKVCTSQTWPSMKLYGQIFALALIEQLFLFEPVIIFLLAFLKVVKTTEYVNEHAEFLKIGKYHEFF